MLSKEQIQKNKEEFVYLINSISREGFNRDLLLSHLDNSDFYDAPASTKFHLNCRGGLVQHSLNVYHNLIKLVDMSPEYYSDDTIKIVSLLHDIAKKNYYESYYKNVKVYSESGSKSDDGGRFDWTQVQEYKLRDIDDRFIYYNHEGTSEFMIRQYCPLSMEESIAILHHHGTMSNDCAKDDINEVYNRFPLACLLHLADMYSVYIDESTYKK